MFIGFCQRLRFLSVMIINHNSSYSNRFFVDYIVIRCVAILKLCFISRQLLLYSDFVKVLHHQEDSEEGPLDKYRSLINFRSYTNHSGWRQLHDFVNVLYKVEETSLCSYFVESLYHRDAGIFKMIFCIIWDYI